MSFRLLDAPEVVVDGGLTVTRTHEVAILDIDPRHGVERRTMKGYFNSAGVFVDHGDHIVDILNKDEYQALLDDKTGGKSAGDFRISDIGIAIEEKKHN